MGLLLFKFVLALLVLGLTLFFGWLPIKRNRENDYFELANYFACGIFLGTAIFHLLMDSVEHFENFTEYPHLYSTVIAVGFALAMFALEQLCDDSKRKIAAYLLTFSLVIHAFIEGLAVGMNQEFLEVIAIFTAVFIHKGSESFAYAVALKNYQMSMPVIKKWMLFFALMTPLGILIASGVFPWLIMLREHCCIAVFNAIAAGTFLYLCIEHLRTSLARLRHRREALYFSGGFLLMALLSLWA